MQMNLMKNNYWRLKKNFQDKIRNNFYFIYLIYIFIFRFYIFI